MTFEELAVKLEAIAERLAWPYEGEPGSNPDYLDSEEVAALREAAMRLRACEERLGND